MKRLMTLTLGLAIAFAAVAPTFAQQEPTKKTKKSHKKKGSKKKENKS